MWTNENPKLTIAPENRTRDLMIARPTLYLTTTNTTIYMELYDPWWNFNSDLMVKLDILSIWKTMFLYLKSSLNISCHFFMSTSLYLNFHTKTCFHSLMQLLSRPSEVVWPFFLPIMKNGLLTLSQTSPGLYVSAVNVFWKHCWKRRNCS